MDKDIEKAFEPLLEASTTTLPKITSEKECPYCESKNLKQLAEYEEEKMILFKCLECRKGFF